MTNGYVGGSVSAEITLNTSKFDEAIKHIKSEVKELKTAFNGFKINDGLKEMQQTIKNQQQSIKNLHKTIDDLRTKNTELAKTNNQLLTSYKNITSELNSYGQSQDKLSSKYTKASEALIKANESQLTLTETMKVSSAKMREAGMEYEFVNQTLRDLSNVANVAKRTLSQINLNKFQSKGTGFNQYRMNLQQINNEAKKVGKEFGNNIPTALQRWSNAQKQVFESGKVGLNTYKQNIKQVQQGLKQYENEIKKVGNYSKTNLATAGQALQTFNRQLNTTKLTQEQLNTASKTGATHIKNFGNSTTQAAHSSRILSNTLYQIRGALLSLKMIFTAMGGMALWGFASELAEGVKETFRAKNEMDAQLAQNSKVGAGGIQYFNKALDDTTKKFKKINKYSIGETVSSIGLEFNLNAKQMAESLDIVSMIQSEYVRAGRKEEEAALAVKDILQGEFSRLSRETGVGKEELISYGWNGDKTDIESLMDALRKAALDRHWDLFAAKATSLNDVVTITKSRFSEFGADLLQSISPVIVGAFNGLLDAITTLENGFNSLSSFWKSAFTLTIPTAGITALITGFMMISKHMGLAEIATIGWKKSLATTVLNLDKASVAQYGFRKALASTIAGVEASELANIRSTKAIMGRILGVNQSVLAEKGYGYALVHNKALLQDGIDLTKTSILNTKTMTTAELTRSQRLAYLTNNIKLNEAAEMSRGKAILKTATSWKVLGTAIKGVMAIGIIVWLANLASWTDKVKTNVDAWHNVHENGKSLIADAQKTVDDYTKSLSQLKEGTDDYIRTKKNLDQANANLTDIKKAKALTDEYEKQNAEQTKNIKIKHQQNLASSYELAGKNAKEATELASGYTEQVKLGQYYIEKSYEEYDKRLYSASQHVNEHVEQLKEAGASTEDMVRYIDEYNLEAENAAEQWKKFNQGDLNAGLYAVLSELKLVWIDISNHPEVVTFMTTLKATWKSWQPTLKQIVGALNQLVLGLVELANGFLSTDLGKNIALFSTLGLTVGVVGKKIYNFVGGTKSTIDILKSLYKHLKEGVTHWRKYGEEVEKTKKKEETPTTTTPDGKTGGTGSFKEQLATSLKNDAVKYARAVVAIAAGMLLITEAIVMLKVPMYALSNVGEQFKQSEPQIRKGIDGLKLISPVMMALLPPAIALAYLFEKFKISFSTIVTGSFKAAVGIAAGLLLVAETIIMITPSLWMIGVLGDQYAGIESQVKKGVEAMKIVSNSLQYLAPFIPAIGLGIYAITLAFAEPEIAAVIGVGVTLGIVAGMLWVAETVASLEYPLRAIGYLGSRFQDLSNVQQGAAALKVTAEAMGYVADALGDFAGIQWSLLSSYIAEIVANWVGLDLDSLTEEGGFFDDLEEFTKSFNALVITPIDSEKVTSLSDSATGIESVKNALVTVKDALKDLPSFEEDNRSINQKYQDNVSGAETTEGISNYFEKLKQPITDLNTFVNDFNNLEVKAPEPEKVTAIQESANFITVVKSAVDAVQQAVGGMGDVAWESSFAAGGIIGAIGNYISPVAGSGGLKSGLDTIYQSLVDIFDFNKNVAELTSSNTSESNDSVGAATSMVQSVSQAIQELNNTLTESVPSIKSNATAIGSGIKDGIKEGVTGLKNEIQTKLNEALDGNQDYANSHGKSLGLKAKDGFKDGIDPMSDVMGDEISAILQKMEDKKQEIYDKAYELGDKSAKGFEDGQDHHSPGRMARAMFSEIDYITESLTNAQSTLPSMTYDLGYAMSNSFDVNSMVTQLNNTLNNTSFDDLTMPMFDYTQNSDAINQFTNDVNQVSQTSTATSTLTQQQFGQMNASVGTNFNNMSNTVGTSFNNIKNNAQSTYQQIANTTKTQLNTMQTQTTNNIGAIRNSWSQMQTALIASAETIRSQTSSKIGQLQSNMASFWRKVQNPALLLGAGSPNETKHTIRRRSPPKFAGNKNKGTSKRRFAGGLTKPKTGEKSTGISDKLKPRNKPFLLDYIAQYFATLKTDGFAVAGGWNFNWSKDIQNALLKWHTNFGDIYDDVLTVGKFENDDFPVKGNATIAKRYIYDAISRTNYDFYYNSRYGDSPLAAWNSGNFNCWDGANVIIALANAFGFGGGYKGKGTWDGFGHVWAVVPGLGIMDATAIQRGYGFTSPKVSGYSAGAKGTIKRGSASKPKDTNNGEGSTTRVVNVNVDLSNSNIYGIDDLDNHIERTTKKVMRDEFNDPSTLPL